MLRKKLKKSLLMLCSASKGVAIGHNSKYRLYNVPRTEMVLLFQMFIVDYKS